MNKKYIIKYKLGGKVITSHDLENADYRLEIVDNEKEYKVKIIPKKTFEMVEFFAEMPYEFKSGDKFFGNGYQSWSTTKEYTSSDI